jgi:DNA-binding MarR family transcriptional regulator
MPQTQSADLAMTAQELRVAVGRVARRLRRMSGMDTDGDALSFTQITLLVRLAREGPMSPTEIAAHEQVTTQAIAAIVRDLEGRRLVTRDAHSTDGRRTVVSISDAGRAAVWDHHQTVVETVVAALDREFTVAEVRRLGAAVPLLNRLADII